LRTRRRKPRRAVRGVNPPLSRVCFLGSDQERIFPPNFFLG
jgi:hypothetical protein